LHFEAAHARQAHHLAGRHGAHHRIAVVTARLQGGQHRQEVLFHEEHRRQHDVGTRDVVAAGLHARGIVAPLAGGVHRQAQTRHLRLQLALGTLGGAADVAVERDEHDAQRGRRRRCRALPCRRRAAGHRPDVQSAHADRLRADGIHRAGADACMPKRRFSWQSAPWHRRASPA
jgi:hypothetical protein